MGADFEPFLNSGFNFTISQSGENIEYFIVRLHILEMGLAITVAPSFENLSDRLSRPGASFSSKSLRSFNTVSSDTKLNLQIELGIFRVLS